MARAEFVGLGAEDVRALGIAGLLHDVGKTRIPIEILTKPGKFTAQERDLMNRHPADGARLILDSEADLEVAAGVAYEHHIMLNGRGYPPVGHPPVLAPAHHPGPRGCSVHALAPHTPLSRPPH